MPHCVRLCCDLCKVWLDEGDNAKRNASFHKSTPKAPVPHSHTRTHTCTHAHTHAHAHTLTHTHTHTHTHTRTTHTHTTVSPAIDIQTSALCSLLSNDPVSQELGLESGSLGPTHTPTPTHIHKQGGESDRGTCISKKPPHNQQTLNYPVSFAPSDINNTCSWFPHTAIGY